MAATEVQANMLSLLYYQHRLYTSELAKSHRSLSKLYKKLERIEKTLPVWKDRGLTRKDKKKLQWDRAITKSTVKCVEAEQALLHNHLRQCSELIDSYIPNVYRFLPDSWKSPLSPTAYPFIPNSPAPATPWTAGPFEERTAWSRGIPQYWDLSMLQEPGHLSSFDKSTNSGFYEHARDDMWLSQNGDNDNNNASLYGQVNSGATSSSQTGRSSNRSSLSEKDALPELATPSSPSKCRAQGPGTHRRRYSENAIQLIESRLEAATTGSRVRSVPPPKRAASETRISKEDSDR
ncbi:hypothetical protein Q7P37_007298 [Cladosporium fusiforme]